MHPVSYTHLEDHDAELEVIQDMADRIQAIKRSVSIRANNSGLAIAFGFSRKAWDYLFPNAPVPKELEDFTGIKGDKQDVPAVPADLFLHVRSNDESVTYTVVDQIMGFLRPITSVVDETHGFHYEQGRAIIDFVDGTENPVGQEAVAVSYTHLAIPLTSPEALLSFQSIGALLHALLNMQSHPCEQVHLLLLEVFVPYASLP